MRVFLVVLLLAVLSVPAMAGPDRAAIFSDCTYYRPVAGATVTLDTLWFTKTQKGATNSFDGVIAGELFDWFPPLVIPVGSDNDGGQVRLKRPVKKVLLHSRVPFTYRVFSNGITPKTWFDIADTNSMVSGPPHSDEFPCWTVVSWPDSIFVAEAGGDSVFVTVGY